MTEVPEKLVMEPKLEMEIMQKRRSASPYFKEKDFKSMKPILDEVWKLIPEPKLRYSESFHVSFLMCEVALGTKNIKLAEEWVEIYKKAALHRLDSGERIFMEARLAYTKGNNEEAKKLFSKADQMSDGRLFENPLYLEYFKFYKKK